MDIKSKGVEIDVSDTKKKHLGDLWITSTKLIWCKGKTPRDNGKAIKGEDFIALMDNR